MLGRYFNFLQDPFNPTPDPRFFYANPMYREAYDSLYGILRDHKGYALLTGKPGVGKTTLLKTLMNNLGAGYRCVYFEYSNLTFDDFLGLACNKLGLETKWKGCGDELKTFLLEQPQQGITVAFIIDEAQNMPPELLIEILNYTDGLSEQENLVQIILSGQTKLEARLEQPQFRALRQRLYLHYRLSPLSRDEVGSFIRHRLNVAGSTSGDIMTNEAIQKVTRHAQGRPRLINKLCSRALITAYATSQKRISAELMEEAIQELYEEQGDAFKSQEKPLAQAGAGAHESADDGPGHTPPAHEVHGLLPWTVEREPQKHWVRTSLSAVLETGRKMLHRGMDKLSALFPEQPLRLPWKSAWENRELPFMASLSVLSEAARKTLQRTIKHLSGLISELPIGLWKGGAVSILLLLLLYSVMEQSPEEAEPVPTKDLTAQTSVRQSHQIDPSSTPVMDNAIPAERPSRNLSANNQNLGIEFAALEVVSKQIDLTALRSEGSVVATLPDGLPKQLAGFPDTTVAATADSAARQDKLEQKLRASEERLAQMEAQLALSREELEKAQARIQQNEAQIEAYTSQTGQSDTESDEPTYSVLAREEHLAQQNSSKPLNPDPSEQPPTQDQARSEIQQQVVTDPSSGIDQLLSRANRLMKARHFTTPVGNNAFEIFSQVLKTDPGNKAGLKGIQQITQQYLEWAVIAVQENDWLNAGNYYKKALLVDPSSPAAEAGLREVREQVARSDEKKVLEALALSRVQEEARQRLAQMGIPETPKALLNNAEQGNVEAVHSLLAAGIAPNAQLSGGWTALMSAATHGHNNVVQELLRQGAEVDLKNDDGKTALMAAAWNGHTDVVKELLTSGAAVNEQNNDGWTALMYAAWNGHRQAVQTLLEGEASVAVKDANDWTALTAATSEGHVEIVNILKMAEGS